MTEPLTDDQLDDIEAIAIDYGFLRAKEARLVIANLRAARAESERLCDEALDLEGELREKLAKSRPEVERRADAMLWAEVLRRGLVELDGTGYASTTERTPPGDTADEVLRRAEETR